MTMTTTVSAVVDVEARKGGRVSVQTLEAIGETVMLERRCGGG
jgi:hypothetical protein